MDKNQLINSLEENIDEVVASQAEAMAEHLAEYMGDLATDYGIPLDVLKSRLFLSLEDPEMPLLADKVKERVVSIIDQQLN
ncbi:hypothetical protein JOC36_000979 [Weissella uvarum]|uniref:hypothetical protein n=1 Tax=Weissella uvarum TaxID=1479233 RepID=UPI001960A94E|nr:hypothetical protein [Weissella uvarum]MBM7617422.1 hypothetical protein [Weissella uvarum]MCM0595693.1 hypothetical protein [Weissella uvarum]